ncbi:50S ribosomal protein L13 [Candidatus Kaiserbacteria bacterium]|nr:50S ribosomal protein L13 [Candidatus Kaiserbacteria bacterium]
MNKTTTYVIDASGRTLGRVASEAAKALMGKTRADYVPHVRSDVEVIVSNASKLRIDERKRTSQTYQRYSGYPGGLKEETLATLSKRKGIGEVIRRAVERMLPRNTMRVARLKNLTVTE